MNNEPENSKQARRETNLEDNRPGSRGSVKSYESSLQSCSRDLCAQAFSDSVIVSVTR